MIENLQVRRSAFYRRPNPNHITALTLTKGRTIQPKLDRTDPVKSAASESAIQYRSDTDSDLPWTIRKYMPISKRKCKALQK